MSSIAILPYSDDLAPLFDRLNRAWIEHYFTIEPFDEEVLTQPQKMIIEPGGELWFASLDGTPVGACALIPFGLGVFEFTKLGVDEIARGKGAARALLNHCIKRAREKGAHTLKIFTSTRLGPANALYRSEGFIEIEMSAEQRQRYKRADIMYDLPLA